MAKSTMTRSSELSRITVDITKASHKKLKAMAALEGKSMREVVSDLIDERILEDKRECTLDHTPNKKTAKIMRDVEKGKGLVKAKSLDDFLKKLGI